MSKTAFIALKNQENKTKFFTNKIKCIEHVEGIEICINNKIINKKMLKRIKKKLEFYKIDKLIFEKEITYNQEEFRDYTIIDGNYIYKNIAVLALKNICKKNKEELKKIDIYILVNDFCNKDLLSDIANNVRCLYIVTNKLKKYQSIEKMLEKKEDVICYISSNKSKILKKANVICNLDFTSEDLCEYKINRYATIIDLSRNDNNLEKIFYGNIIKNLKVNYEKKYTFNIEQFDKFAIIENELDTKNYRKIYEYFEKNCSFINDF